MNGLEIFLIIVGIVIVIASFVIADNSAKSQKEEEEQAAKEALRLDLEEQQRKANEIRIFLEDTKEEIMNTAENDFRKVSNEKVMEINEFAEQILVKIEKNHKEVIFLYNMLTEKEKEIKKLMQDHDMKKWQKTKEDTVGKRPVDHKPKSQGNKAGAGNSDKKVDLQAALVKENAKRAVEVAKEEGKIVNNNDKILKLYQEGKSIMEISKILDQGQGEIQLVIDLFQGDHVS